MKISVILIMMMSCMATVPKAVAQSAEVQQLLLDVTKLAQFKQILKDLQTGYSILNKGYGTIKQIASGNFSLHRMFIDGLLTVNPSLAKYRRVADIISDEKAIVSQYKTAYAYFKSGGRLDAAALDYLAGVYARLVNKSAENLDALATVLTADKLSMTDDERLTEINRLYRDTHQLLQFLTGLNGRVTVLTEQLEEEALSITSVKTLTGIK